MIDTFGEVRARSLLSRPYFRNEIRRRIGQIVKKYLFRL
jgi:hypothetical protein